MYVIALVHRLSVSRQPKMNKENYDTYALTCSKTVANNDRLFVFILYKIVVLLCCRHHHKNHTQSMLVRIAFVNLIVCQRVATLNDIHITQKRLDQHQFFSFELINSLLFCVCWIKPKTLTKTTTMTTLLRLHFVGKNTDITYHDLKNNNKEFVCFIFEEKKKRVQQIYC